MGRRKDKKKVTFLDPEFAAVLAQLDEDEEFAMGGVHLPMSLKGDGSVVGQYNGQVTGGTGYSVYKGCSHTGDVVVFEHEGKQIFASSWQGLKEASGQWKLIIDLAGNIRPPQPPPPPRPFLNPITTGRFKPLEKFVKVLAPVPPPVIPSEVLSLDWNDMGIPPVSYGFWTQLWEMLPETTVIACQGGHGRTGTCIAGLMIVTNRFTYWDAIKEVHTMHCEKAVESLSQEKYLHALYVEHCKRGVASATPEHLDGWQKTLAYAEEHPPSAGHSVASKGNFGGSTANDDFIQGSGKILHMPLMASEHNLTNLSYNNKKFRKVCVMISCNTGGVCTVPGHQGWVEDLNFGS